MQPRLWHRLFLAFALLSILALAAFAMLQTRSFQRGFLDYVNRLERERAEEGVVRLAQAYALNGDWEFLRGDTPRLLRILQLGGPPPAGAEDPQIDPRIDPQYDRPPRPRHEPPPRRRRDPGFEGPPPPRDALDEGPEFGPPRPRPAPPGLQMRPRLLLLDAQGTPVAGNPSLPRDTPALTVEYQGRAIGRLLMAPLPQLRSDLDLAFAREQRRHMALIAASVLLISLLSALLVSRWLLRPVRALTVGTRALASGDYAARIEQTRADEFGALARDFNALAVALERHRDARRQWGADIAHELRTPISVLSGEIQALQDGVRQVDASRLASLQAECTRLRALVDDLYQLSLSEAGGLSYRFEPVDLGEIVHEAARAHAGVLHDAGLILVAAAVPASCELARGDRTRLRQLLDNLLGNAQRYTDRPGRVVLSLDRLPNGGCRLRIDDTAPGVPDDALPQLFERLYRAEPSRSRRYGGAGLGLAICRNIVEAHGGRIAAAHSPEGGLRIEIEFPPG